MGGRRARLRGLEAELRATEARYRALAESAVEAVFTADRRGRITYANSAAESLFGYAPGLLVGESLTTLMPERYRAEHEAGLALVAATGRTTLAGTVVGLAGLRSDGTEFEVELALDVWHFEEELSFSAILRAVSQREAARERDELVQAARRAVGGAADLRSAVEGLATILGRALALQRIVYTSVDGDGREAVMADWASGGPPGRSQVAVEVTIGEQLLGRVDAWVGSAIAVGADQVALVERVLTEVAGGLHPLQLVDRERQLAVRVREVDELKRDFVAMVGHDLRPPLGVVADQAALLRDQWAGLGESEKLECITTMAERVDALVSHLDGVVQVVRLESGPVGRADEEVDLSELAEQVLDEMRVAWPGHTWRAAVTGGRPVVSADRTDQRQILANLAGNAATCSPPGTTVEVSITRRATEVLVEVSDRGAGIPGDDLPKLFQRVWRTTQPGDGSRVDGTGLGLYICRLLVERGGGSIRAGRREGGGSTFSYTVPLGRAPRARRRRPS